MGRCEICGWMCVSPERRNVSFSCSPSFICYSRILCCRQTLWPSCSLWLYSSIPFCAFCLGNTLNVTLVCVTHPSMGFGRESRQWLTATCFPLTPNLICTVSDCKSLFPNATRPRHLFLCFMLLLVCHKKRFTSLNSFIRKGN